MHRLISLFVPPLHPAFFLTLSALVPVLVFVVPAVEVYVERHDAARCHAGDKSPEGRGERELKIMMYKGKWMECV